MWAGPTAHGQKHGEPARSSSSLTPVQQVNELLEVADDQALAAGGAPVRRADQHASNPGRGRRGGVDVSTVAYVHGFRATGTEVAQRDEDSSGVRLERTDARVLRRHDSVEAVRDSECLELALRG